MISTQKLEGFPQKKKKKKLTAGSHCMGVEGIVAKVVGSRLL